MLPIEFVSEEEQLVAFRETGRPSPGPGEYQTWEKLHDALVAVAEEYGSASERPNPLPDFYHTGDWFDEYRDGFTLPTTKGLTAQALREFQVAVAAHHPRASLALVGQADEIKGLESTLLRRRSSSPGMGRRPRNADKSWRGLASDSTNLNNRIRWCLDPENLTS